MFHLHILRFLFINFCRLGSRFNWSLRGCQLPYNLRTLKLGEDFNQSMEGVWDPGISGMIGWYWMRFPRLCVFFSFRNVGQDELKWKWWGGEPLTCFDKTWISNFQAQFRLPDLGHTVHVKTEVIFPSTLQTLSFARSFNHPLEVGFSWTQWLEVTTVTSL